MEKSQSSLFLLYALPNVEGLHEQHLRGRPHVPITAQ